MSAYLPQTPRSPRISHSGRRCGLKVQISSSSFPPPSSTPPETHTMVRPLPNMASVEARPRTIDRPSYFGSHMDPAAAHVINGSGDPLNDHVNTAPREVKLPPGIDLPTFNKAIEQLRAAVGDEWVELNDVPLNSGAYLVPGLKQEGLSHTVPQATTTLRRFPMSAAHLSSHRVPRAHF